MKKNFNAISKQFSKFHSQLMQRHENLISSLQFLLGFAQKRLKQIFRLFLLHYTPLHRARVGMSRREAPGSQRDLWYIDNGARRYPDT